MRVSVSMTEGVRVCVCVDSPTLRVGKRWAVSRDEGSSTGVSPFSIPVVLQRDLRERRRGRAERSGKGHRERS